MKSRMVLFRRCSLECLAVVLTRARCDRRWISAGVNVGEGEGGASSALVKRRWDACLS